MSRFTRVFAFVLASVPVCAAADSPNESPLAIVSTMANRAISGPEDQNKALRKAHFSSALQAYEKYMKPDDWQDFDADDFTGTQDLSGVMVKSVAKTKRGADTEIVVTYGNNDTGRTHVHFKVGYVVKQDTQGDWKIDDFIYYVTYGILREKSFRKMYAASAYNPAQGQAVAAATSATQQQQASNDGVPGIPPAPGYVTPRGPVQPRNAEADKAEWGCEVRSRVVDLMNLRYLRPRNGRFLVAFKVSGTGDVVEAIVQGEPEAAHRAEEMLRATHMPVPPDGGLHTISVGVNFSGSQPTQSRFPNGCASQQK